jgi:hypothetical protein
MHEGKEFELKTKHANIQNQKLYGNQIWDKYRFTYRRGLMILGPLSKTSPLH